MDHMPVWVHVSRLLLVSGALSFAGAARGVPTASTDWVLAGTILLAAVIQAEITWRAATGHDEPPALSPASVSAWAMVAAIAVHLTLAIALVAVLQTYRCLRERRGAGDLFDMFAGNAFAVIAAHFVASHGAWATPSPRPDTGGVLTMAAAVAAALIVDQAAGFLHHRRVFLGRAADLGLVAALLTTGAVVGALAPAGFLVVLAAIPVVVMLHGAALTQRLVAEASVDTKTGLATAECWQATADRTVADAEPGRGPVGVLMIDLDHFKRLNDTYGHPAGDDVLAAVGACLREQLRHNDLAGRFGGEEFTVLLPGTDVADTMAAAERVRAAIALLHVATVDNHGRHLVVTDVTASVGVAVHPRDGATAHECLRVADSRVYQAKRQGRNVVVGAEVPFIPRPRER
jgi:diguanylate cyclase (GGDEF)-like protein